MAKFTRHQAMAIVGKVALEKAGCFVKKRHLNGTIIELFDVASPSGYPFFKGAGSEEGAISGAAEKLLSDSGVCIDVLIDPFNCEVMINRAKNRYGDFLWRATIYSEDPAILLFGVDKHLPVAIALAFTTQRGVKFDPEVLRALEAEE